MQSINHVIISGNLTRDAEMKALPSGTPVAEFGMAVNDRVKEGSDWKDRPNFIDCAYFGNGAQALYDRGRLVKGARVVVEGRLRYESWTQDGQTRSKLKVVAERIEVMTDLRTQQYAQPVGEPAYTDIPF